MSFEKANGYLTSKGYGDRVLVFDTSSATVALAAEAVGCLPAHIAKSLSFIVDGKPILVIAAGDAKVDNSRFKAQFHVKASMIAADQVEALIGHGVGGVCPFGINDGVKVYLDESLYRFDTVYPACGSSNSAVRLALSELEELSAPFEKVDVCKAWRDEEIL